jgi:hypothetical protein
LRIREDKQTKFDTCPLSRKPQTISIPTSIDFTSPPRFYLKPKKTKHIVFLQLTQKVWKKSDYMKCVSPQSR